MNLTNRLAAVALATGGLLLAAEPAHAVLSLTFEQGANSVTVTDGGLNDANSLADAVTFVGSVGTFQLNVSTAISKSQATLPLLIDLSSLNSGIGTLTITAIEDNVTDPGLLARLHSDIGGTLGTNAQLTYETYINGVLVSSLAFGPSIGAFSGSDAHLLDPVVNGPYEVKQVVTITHTTHTQSSFDAAVRVPEPAMLGLLGAGLAAIGMVRRRARRGA